MKLHFTSGYHPEGDRQTEHINQTLEQYLRIYCNFQQDDWHTLLPIAEFCYNNTPSFTTGVSPVKQKRRPDRGLNPGPSRHIPDALTTELSGLTRQVSLTC
jgi:hypothetical protein